MKILMISFGHIENVLSISKAISKMMNFELMFIFSGNCFQQGILNMDLTKLPYGVSEDQEFVYSMFPEEIKKFINHDFKVFILRTPSRKILKDYKMKNLRIIFKAFRNLEINQYDALHINGTSGFIIYLYIIFRKISKIWTLHDYISHSGEEDWKNSVFNKLMTKLNFFFIQHYEFLRTEFINHYHVKPSKVYHIYSGSFEIFKQFNEKKPPFQIPPKFILFFGRISKYKGINYLVEAFENFNNSFPEVFLIVAGKGRLWIEQNKLKPNNNIIFYNKYLETPELIYLLKRCLFVTLPYTDATHSAVVMTSYAFRKPVIATNIGGLKEVVLDNITGLLLSPF